MLECVHVLLIYEMIQQTTDGSEHTARKTKAAAKYQKLQKLSEKPNWNGEWVCKRERERCMIHGNR